MTAEPRPVHQEIQAEPGAHIQNVVQAFIEQVTLGVRALPTDYATRIANFLCDYLGTPGRPVPFGGREEALQALDRWLDDPTTPPYLLLAAPAGRGKSALLVRWLERLRQRALDLPVVFVPISLRYNTASQAVFFAALAARLAHLFGEKVPADLNQAPAIWRGMVSGYLSRPAPNGRLLVVLDGLDEATDWQAGPDLFPFQPPPGLRIVVSARYLAGERGPEGWLRRLEWDRHRLARPLDLDPLTREGVAEVLQNMGFPLDELGRRVDIVAELHRLSEGDPLLVRLYVDDLWAKGEAAARLQPEDLRSLRPGLEGYFDRWWEDQRKQWGEKAPLKEPAVREVLNLLAAALAPLGQEDLLALSGLDTWTLAEALRPLARLVVGDGKQHGYAFSHPRLGQYFWEKLSRGERQALERRFLDWGLGCVERLRRGEMAPRDVSPYLVRALGGHLTRAGAGPEDWLRLVHGAWAGANEALEGAYSLFLHDVTRAWRACAAADWQAAARDEPAPYLGGEVRCALVEASLHSLAGNIPPALLAALVEKGVWTPAQGLAYARQMPDPRQQAETLEKLAPHLPENLLAQALAAAREIWDDSARAWALAALAPRLAELGYPQEALAAAREIGDEYRRAEALANLAPHLPENLLAQALAAAGEIGDEYQRTRALAVLATRLPPDQQPQVLTEAMATANRIRGAAPRALALVVLAPHLPAQLRLQALAEALAATRGIGDLETRARTLATLVLRLAELCHPIEALAAAKEIRDEFWRARVLAVLTPHLPPEQQPQVLTEALAAAKTIENESTRAQALATLAPHLPPGEQPQVLAEALAAARKIQDESARADTLAVLAPRLAELGYPQEALDTAEEIRYAYDRAKALAALAPHLPPDLLPQALDAAKRIEKSARAYALAALALRLAVLGYSWEALTTAKEIWDADDRTRALAALTPHLPPDLQEQALRQALAAAREIRDADCRASALADMVPHLPPHLLAEALAAARGIKDVYQRARALAELTSRLPSGLLTESLTTLREIRDANNYARAALSLISMISIRQLLDQALDAAREIEWESARAESLTAPTLHLPPDLEEQALRQALVDVREIGNEYVRTQALADLAPRLAELPRPTLYPLWDETLPLLARQTRRRLLADLRALVPVIHALGGEAAIAETFRALQDVARWWP